MAGCAPPIVRKRPNDRQIPDTDDCDSPVSSAIDLVDQCVFCPRPFSVRTPGDHDLDLLVGIFRQGTLALRAIVRWR